jgi:hypothetical protein
MTNIFGAFAPVPKQEKLVIAFVSFCMYLAEAKAVVVPGM